MRRSRPSDTRGMRGARYNSGWKRKGGYGSREEVELADIGECPRQYQREEGKMVIEVKRKQRDRQ